MNVLLKQSDPKCIQVVCNDARFKQLQKFFLRHLNQLVEYLFKISEVNKETGSYPLGLRPTILIVKKSFAHRTIPQEISQLYIILVKDSEDMTGEDFKYWTGKNFIFFIDTSPDFEYLKTPLLIWINQLIFGKIEDPLSEKKLIAYHQCKINPESDILKFSSNDLINVCINHGISEVRKLSTTNTYLNSQDKYVLVCKPDGVAVHHLLKRKLNKLTVVYPMGTLFGKKNINRFKETVLRMKDTRFFYNVSDINSAEVFVQIITYFDSTDYLRFKGRLARKTWQEVLVKTRNNFRQIVYENARKFVSLAMTLSEFDLQLNPTVGIRCRNENNCIITTPVPYSIRLSNFLGEVDKQVVYVNGYYQEMGYDTVHNSKIFTSHAPSYGKKATQISNLVAVK